MLFIHTRPFPETKRRYPNSTLSLFPWHSSGELLSLVSTVQYFIAKTNHTTHAGLNNFYFLRIPLVNCTLSENRYFAEQISERTLPWSLLLFILFKSKVNHYLSCISSLSTHTSYSYVYSTASLNKPLTWLALWAYIGWTMNNKNTSDPLIIFLLCFHGIIKKLRTRQIVTCELVKFKCVFMIQSGLRYMLYHQLPEYR